MADELKIALDGSEYPLIPVDDMTMREQREFEKIAGAGADKLAKLDTDYRAGLVVAWMAVSIKRAKPQQSMDGIVEHLDQLKQADLEKSWESIIKVAELVGQNPPEQKPSDSEPSAEKESSSGASGNDSGPPPVAENPSATGQPNSDTGADSVPPTSPSLRQVS